MAITQPSDGFVRTNELRCRNVDGRRGVLDQKWIDPTGKRFEWVALPIVNDWQDGLTEWEGDVTPIGTGRYWVFAGSSYYATGGMGDFVGKFDTIETAQSAGEAAEHRDWWHVLDTTSMKVVAVRQGGYTGRIDEEMLA